MRPAVNYLGGTIAPSFSAQRANHDDGGDRKTVCSGKHIVAAFLAADHARFRKRQSSHRQYYRGRKGEDQGFPEVGFCYDEQGVPHIWPGFGQKWELTDAGAPVRRK
jgi:hypothetical protein